MIKLYRVILPILLVCAVLSGCVFQPLHHNNTGQTIPSYENTTQETPGPSTTESVSETTVEPETVPVTQPSVAEPADSEFVLIREYIPDIVVDLKYATEDNFTGQVIYSFTEPYARYGTVKKLQTAQAMLAPLGYGLKVWDAFRPVSAQYKLWEVCPDPTYVANPNNGFSSHSRGNTVDITIIRLEDGSELTMPTGFDDFSAMANRDYSDCSQEARENAVLLEAILTACGFKGYYGEWWHYTDETGYEVEQSFDPAIG